MKEREKGGRKSERGKEGRKEGSLMVGRVGLERRLNFKELMILIVVLGKTLESPQDYKEIKPVHPKGNQP